MKKRTVCVLIALMTAALAAGCGSQTDSGNETREAAQASAQEDGETEKDSGKEEGEDKTLAGSQNEGGQDAGDEEKNVQDADDEENYDTGDASRDDPRNGDEIGDNELLVVSFGTSYNDNRVKTIGAIEAYLESQFKDYSVRRAFTSQIIIDHVKKRDGEEIDNMEQALERAADNGVKNLVVQPTHLMNGLEYEELQETLAGYSDAFERIVVGEPLLMSEDDFKRVEQAIVGATEEYDDGETAICFMGHGTEAKSNQIYEKMQTLLADDGYKNYYIGTVEATPTVEDVLAKVKDGSYKKVLLRPLMIVAGDHANNDMAGDEEGSWKKIFEDAGYEVECVVEGLGSLEEIQKILAEHAQAAIDQLK